MVAMVAMVLYTTKSIEQKINQMKIIEVAMVVNDQIDNNNNNKWTKPQELQNAIMIGSKDTLTKCWIEDNYSLCMSFQQTITIVLVGYNNKVQ